MRCPLCRSKRIQILTTVKEIYIFRCEICDLGFVDQTVSQIYSLHHFYQIKEYKKGLPKLTRRIISLIKHIRQFKTEGRVLEIGAGFGLFSSLLAKYKDYKITLVEPEQKPVFALNSRVKIIRKTFSEFAQKSNEKFDLIILLDVIEHFYNIKKEIKTIKKLLARDGILVIQTPNYKSAMRYLCKHWSWWMIEDHRFFFTKSSLENLLDQESIRCVFLKTYEDFIDFKKNLDGNFSSISNAFVRKFYKFFFFLAFFVSYFITRKILWKLNLGGLIFVIAKKMTD